MQTRRFPKEPHEQSRTQVIRAPDEACTLLNVRHAYILFAHVPSQKWETTNEKKEEVARVVETLALGAVGKSPQKIYLGK